MNTSHINHKGFESIPKALKKINKKYTSRQALYHKKYNLFLKMEGVLGR